MGRTIRRRIDTELEAISDALGDYEKDHPGSEIVLYRQNPASVRVRIVDPDFRGQDRG